MGKYKFRILEEWRNKSGLYNCPECILSFSKMGLISHYYRKHDERGIKFIKDRKDKSKKHNKKVLTKEEISKRISDGMIKMYKEGRGYGWSHINSDKNRRSYPEKFFLKVFKSNIFFKDFDIREKFPYNKYFIDFLITDLKLIIEIDGDQHFRTEEAILHDKVRDDFFLEECFKIYRIKWSDVMKNVNYEISSLIEFIKDIDNKTIRKYTIDDINPINICKCGNIIKTKKSIVCRDCSCKSRRLVERPPIDTLIREVSDIGYSATGRKYGVSDNAIRKWIKNG